MGAALCCFPQEELEEHAYVNGANHRNCSCLRCFTHHLRHMYNSLFQRGEMRAIATSIPGTTINVGGLVSNPLDNSIADSYRPPPRPLPYDVDPRYSRPQRDGLISRREKSSTHLYDETEPLRSGLDSLSPPEKWNGAEYEGQSKSGRFDSSIERKLMKLSGGVPCVPSSTEDEDVCPTCLEEYTPENPKIMTQCSHHFHLGCIYEWMERSETCPVCGKEMIFNESP